VSGQLTARRHYNSHQAHQACGGNLRCILAAPSIFTARTERMQVLGGLISEYRKAA
jgi:hypothetical protein